VIYRAKEKIAEHLAKLYGEKLLSLYELNHEPKSKELDSLSMGKRSIKNRVLKILSANDTLSLQKLIQKQYEESVTMTDRVVALDILENSSAEYKNSAFSDFYKKYNHETLVMNKYFSILCASHREGTLQRVIKLQEDEAYDEKIPNLVRSVIGVFARNYKYFHAKDGSGYRFIAQKIIEIDEINPQMASGLAGAFKIYNKMNDENKKLMKIELECVLSTQSLSKNSFEIINKILKKD
jgi:aminopeptidase N